MSDLLQNLLTEPHAALEADADFLDPSGNPMAAFIIEDKGDIETQLNQALARLGIAIILDIIEGDCDARDAYPVLLSPVKLVVEISENVVTNRKAGQVAGTDYLTLRQALGMVMDKLHLWQYTSKAALSLSKPAFRMTAPPRGATAAYQVYFETSETLDNTRSGAIVTVSGTGTVADTLLRNTRQTLEGATGNVHSDTGTFFYLNGHPLGCVVLLFYWDFLSKWALLLADESEYWTNDAPYGDGTIPTTDWSVGQIAAAPAPTITY